MANINISGIPDQEKANYTKLAEESGATSRSEWLRWRLRTGVQLWDCNGRIDIESVDGIVAERGQKENYFPDSENDIKSCIVHHLSTQEIATLDELQQAVFDELVIDALYELLKEGEVENIPGSGYRSL
ncbi:hypothetical protein PM022_13425 [Halorubrum ezzemoulense]|uniref:hypothetical protein n=1 Tax=Halorubrum ezzemoulense TaxID=337243 RepID=UPI00233002C7|nr:hypothetical protein [Halorubrum ezzemoulense]MDB2275518.1 hypothetical protein [Halorubrum ezzemoulense]